MNVKQAEKKLLELMRRKPQIRQPGRLVAHLLNELNVESDSNRSVAQTIEHALEKLEKDGIIRLQRSGRILNGYRVVKKTKKRATSVAAQSVSTEPQPEASREEEAVESPKELSRAEEVTLALLALQGQADEQGNLYVSSTAEVIAESLGVSLERAKELNRPLGQLELRISPVGRNPQGKRPHWVSREVSEVTEEMLAGAEKLRPAPGEATTDETEQQLLDIIEGLEAQLVEAAGAREDAERLAEVVGELEAKVAEYDTTMREATIELDRKGQEVKLLKEEHDRLTLEVRELRAQQMQRATPSKRTQDILARYGKATT